jgi:hypothetical protein
MNSITESVVTVMIAIIGLASLAVLVSRNARTTDIIDSTGDAFNNSLLTAISPVMGGSGFGGTNFRQFG